MPSSAQQRPSCSLALWQTNSSPLSENKWAHSSGGSHWQTRGRSTALMPARARGSGCLDLRSSSAPLSAPTLLHLLSLEGNWRRTRVGELRAPWQGASSARMGHRCIHLHGSSGQSHRADDQTENSSTVEDIDAHRDITAQLWIPKYSSHYCHLIMVAWWIQQQSCPELTLYAVFILFLWQGILYIHPLTLRWLLDIWCIYFDGRLEKCELLTKFLPSSVTRNKY